MNDDKVQRVHDLTDRFFDELQKKNGRSEFDWTEIGAIDGSEEQAWLECFAQAVFGLSSLRTGEHSLWLVRQELQHLCEFVAESRAGAGG